MAIEAIPGPMSKVYALIARTSPCLSDIHKEVAQEVCARIPSGRVLDIGTGPGYLPFEIAKRNPRLEITGIDLSSGMVDIARKKAAMLGLSGRVQFQLANAVALPFEPGSFDHVVSTLSFHHWAQPAACIREIHRVLKPGHEAAIYDLRRDTAREVDGQIRKRYGGFLAFMFLRFVRAHSSVTFAHAEEVLASVKEPFAKKYVDAKGIVLAMRFVKEGAV